MPDSSWPTNTTHLNRVGACDTLAPMTRGGTSPKRRGAARIASIAATVAGLAACGGSGTSAPDGSFLPVGTFVPEETFGPAESFAPGEEPFESGDTFAPSGGFEETGEPDTNGTFNVLRFTPRVIIDPAAGNIAAVVFLLPQGWQYRGGVEWLPDWTRAAFLQTQIADPTTGITIDYLPLQDFIWFQAPDGFDAPIGGNYQGKAYVPPITDPATFVTRFWMTGALSHLQGAQLVSAVQVPPIAEEFKRQFGGPADAFAYRLRYEYQQNGIAWEQDVSFALLYAGGSAVTSWYVNYAYTVRAPQGQLDRNAGVISTIVASYTTTPEWDGVAGVVRRLFTQGIQQQMADTEAFGRTLAAHRAESAALQAQVAQERQASQDRIAGLRRETLGGVETYNDTVNGVPVQLPVGFNEYWVNQRGEYLSSAEAGFDPNSLNDGFWQLLERRG
jgi:hypothetical protein